MTEVELLLSHKPIDYQSALFYMEQRVAQIISGKGTSLIWFLEHKDVYTIGRTGSDADIIDNSCNIPIHHTNRGGKTTFHGIGQRVIYFALDLKKLTTIADLDIRVFIQKILQSVVNSLSHFAIKAFIDQENIGVWLNKNNKNYKIASLGIKLKKWIAYHGMSVNINPNLEFFDNIISCGIQGCNTTSLSKELQEVIELVDFDSIMKNELKKTLNLKIIKEIFDFHA